ncbi:hypothetical protein [Mycobacterium basiliense]|uniref:hypothetical protein n=1 Tax=Mycobacterium basiliense TaxID=2094119 RepID=UPI0039EED5B6
MTALASGSGIAHADPEDATPPIIDDLLILIQPPLQDPREQHASHPEGVLEGQGRIGMVCQNRNIKCQKMGF